jgi:hypothetical protein
MARKKGDGKRAIQDIERNAGDYQRITDAQWKVLLDKLRSGPLPLHAKRRIDVFNAIFSVFQPVFKRSVKVTDILRAITLWQKRTEVLRNQVAGPPEAEIPRGQINRDWIEKTYLSGWMLKSVRQDLHLEFLARILDAAIAAAKYVEQELNNPAYEGAETHELWFMWVALIEHTLRHCDIHTSARSDSDKQQTASPFVQFIEGLQRQLPADCQKYRTANSIAKGIQRARREFSAVALDVILLILIAHRLGWVEFDDGTVKATGRFGTNADRLVDYFPEGDQPTVTSVRDIIDVSKALIKATDAGGVGGRKEREEKRAKKT